MLFNGYLIHAIVPLFVNINPKKAEYFYPVIAIQSNNINITI